MLPNIVKPYLDHPMVSNKDERDLQVLDGKELNDIIRAEDQIIRGVREYYLDSERQYKRLNPGQFSSSVMIGRGLAFLDVAHYKKNVMDICNDVWKITPTTSKRASFNQNIKSSTIRRLIEGGLIELDSNEQNVIACIPYPIGSKLFVQKNLLENTRLYREQINHFNIIHNIQDFPELKSELESNSTAPLSFDRDYGSLEEIDVIRSQSVGNREYTFAKTFLTGKQSLDAWLKVLDTTNNVRMGLKELMDIQGDFGGFISYSEIVQCTGWNPRAVNRLMRTIDNIGISDRTYTLDLKDALSRSTEGTLFNMNYHELNNAHEILLLTRRVPESIEILYRLQKQSEASEEELMDEFGINTVQIVRNTLKQMGVISKEAVYEGSLKLVSFRGNEQFLSDVLTVSAHSRHVIDPDYDIDKKIEPTFNRFDENMLRNDSKQIQLDFGEIIDDEYSK